MFLYFVQDGGTLDPVLSLFGSGGDHAWLGDPRSANTARAGFSVWRSTGLNLVLFLGAIQSVPGELYELPLHALEGQGTISRALFRFKGPSGAHWEDISAGAVLVILPTLLVFLLPQRSIYDGSSQGATK